MQGSSTSEILNVYLISSLIILLLIAGVAIFMVIYQRRLVRQRLTLQEKELEYQRNVIQATVETQEKERFRIGKDLHDEVGAMLSAVKMNLNLLDRRLRKAEVEGIDMGEAKGMLDDAIGNVRGISHDLLPPSLEKFGLPVAVQGFTEKLSQLAGIPIRLETRGEVFRLPPAAELGIFRVIQELCNNSLKHAEASGIEVKMDFRKVGLQVEFRDDGKGFDYEARKSQAAGLGLLNMQNRIQMCGGSFNLDSRPGEGVRVSINVPAIFQT